MHAEDKINFNQTVAELVLEHPRLREELERLGIDYCCGGKKPLSEAVADAGLDRENVKESLQAALVSGEENEEDVDWAQASLSALTDHILDKHHAFMKEQLPRLDGLLSKVQKAHGERHGEMLGHLQRTFDGLRQEIEQHLMKEEQILFPAIKGTDEFLAGTGPKPFIHCGTVANPIRQMEHEHDNAGDALAKMRQITDNYQLPSDACQSFAALFDGLQAMEKDLHEHIHLENNILFPKSVEQEELINLAQRGEDEKNMGPITSD